MTKQSLFRVSALFSAAIALVSSLVLAPVSDQALLAQDAPDTAKATGPTDEATLPWWRVQELAKTTKDTGSIVDVSNRVFFRSLNINEGSNEIEVEGAVRWAIPRQIGEPLEGINVTMELYYKHAGWSAVSNTKHYTRVATANAKTVRAKIEHSPSDMMAVSFKVPMTIPVTTQGPRGQVETKYEARPIMPGEYQVKLLVYPNAQEENIRLQMLHPDTLLNTRAIASSLLAQQNDPFLIAKMKNEGWFDNIIRRRYYSDAMITDWHVEIDPETKKETSRTPLKGLTVMELKTDYAGAHAALMSYLSKRMEKTKAHEIGRVNSTEVGFNVALAKLYVRPKGFKPAPNTPAYLLDQTFLDNGSLQEGESIARLVAHRKKLDQDLMCWEKRKKIWGPRASGGGSLFKEGSPEDRAARSSSFWYLPNAKYKLLVCNEKIEATKEAKAALNQRILAQKGPLGTASGFPEVTAIYQAEKDRVGTINDTLNRFDDPILYGMAEVIQGDFKYWRWRALNLNEEVYRTIYFNRFPWQRKQDPHVFMEDPAETREVRSPTNQTEWLQWLYAIAYVRTHGNAYTNKDGKEAIFAGYNDKKKNGGVYSNEILTLIRRDLYGEDEVPGTEDDFSLDPYIAPNSARFFTREWVQQQNSSGDTIEFYRAIPEARLNATATDGTKVYKGAGLMLNERNWILFEERFAKMIGVAVRNEKKPMSFAPFATTYNHDSREFDLKMPERSTMARIDAISTKGKYFPNVGRYEKQINLLRDAAEQLAYSPQGVRYQIMLKMLSSRFQWEAPNVKVKNYDGSGRPQVVMSRNGNEIPGGASFHEFIEQDYRKTPRSIVDKAIGITSTVNSELRLNPNNITTHILKRNEYGVIANWWYHAGNGKQDAFAKRRITLPPPPMPLDPKAFEARQAARRMSDRRAAINKARADSIKKGDPKNVTDKIVADKIAELDLKENERIAREKAKVGDPEDCPIAQQAKALEERRKAAAAASKKPTSITASEIAQLALSERVPERVGFLDPEVSRGHSVHSTTAGKGSD